MQVQIMAKFCLTGYKASLASDSDIEGFRYLSMLIHITNIA